MRTFDKWNTVKMTTTKNNKIKIYRTNLCPKCSFEALVKTNYCGRCGKRLLKVKEED